MLPADPIRSAWAPSVPIGLVGGPGATGHSGAPCGPMGIPGTMRPWPVRCPRMCKVNRHGHNVHSAPQFSVAAGFQEDMRFPWEPHGTSLGLHRAHFATSCCEVEASADPLPGMNSKEQAGKSQQNESNTDPLLGMNSKEQAGKSQQNESNTLKSWRQNTNILECPPYVHPPTQDCYPPCWGGKPTVPKGLEGLRIQPEVPHGLRGH